MAARYNTLDSRARIGEANLSVWQVPCLGRWSHNLDTARRPDEGIRTTDRCVCCIVPRLRRETIIFN